MSIVLYALGVIINGIIGIASDISINIAANVLYDTAKTIYDTITIQRGRDLKVIHPVIETALVNSFYNAIILSLNKTRDYYKSTSSKTYKKEIIQISARIKDLSKLLKNHSTSSGYSLILESFCEVIGNGTVDNTNRLITIAKNNLIGLPEKSKSDLENNFTGIFLILFKEKFASDDILRSLLTFDMLRTNLSISNDTNKKIDSLIYSHINIESELNNISETVSNLSKSTDLLELRDMLIGIQGVLSQLSQPDEHSAPSNILLEKSYLDIIYNKHKHMELPSFDGSKKRVSLKDIYCPLELINRIAVTIDSSGKVTKMPISEIDDFNALNFTKKPILIERMSIYDILPRNQNAFIIGHNGTGKSIIAQHLLCCLSGVQSPDSNYWNEEKLKYGLTNSDEIPIYISLQKYYQYNKFGNGASDLLAYIEQQFNLQEKLIDYLKQKLINGKVIFIVEDCVFSEIPASIVLLDFSDLINNYPRCRYIIFRAAGNDPFYETYSSFDSIPKFELSRLNLKSMREISDKYYHALSSFYNTTDYSFEKFYETIKNIGLMSLLEIPYWFVILLMMSFEFKELPNSMYNICIQIADNMLHRFFSSLDNFLEFEKQNLIKSFEALSIEIFTQIADSKVILKGRAQEIFEKYFTFDKTLSLIKKFESNSCELLTLNENGSIDYIHKPLISALIARYYKHHYNEISILVDNAIKYPNIWVEPLELLFDENNYDLLSFVLYMIQNLSSNCNNTYSILSLRILSKVNVINFTTRAERLALYKSAIISGKELISNGTLSLPDRLALAEDLSLVSTTNNLEIDIDSYFSLIPSGIVVLGNDNLTHGEPYEYNIDYNYYAAKLPVTNLEYQQFLLENPEQPIPFDELNIWDNTTRCIDKRFLNHPVVGVNFHDALKFCQWINSKINLPSGYKAWLPSDPEWMKMYRGGKEINGILNEIPDRLYPWGNEWVEGYANLSKLKNPICATTPVGIFVEGASLYGCYDTCGNVLEWTTTSWGGLNPEVAEFHHPYNSLDGRENLELPGLRITRGGSFLFSEGDAKCSCRLDPESKFPDTGFRVFLIPNS